MAGARACRPRFSPTLPPSYIGITPLLLPDPRRPRIHVHFMQKKSLFELTDPAGDYGYGLEK